MGSTAWIKGIGGLLAVGAVFFAGYRYAAALYEADIAELIAEHAKNSKELTNDYRRKERESAKKLAEAWNALERARAESVDLRNDVERVRDEAAALKREMSRAPTGACSPCRAKLAECSGLLERGAALLERGAREYGEVAADKDAIVKMK